MFTVPSDSTPYKIVKQSGFYKKTLLRDILLEDEIDEGRMILANEDTIVVEFSFKSKDKQIRGFKPGNQKNTLRKIK